MRTLRRNPATTTAVAMSALLALAVLAAACSTTPERAGRGATAAPTTTASTTTPTTSASTTGARAGAVPAGDVSCTGPLEGPEVRRYDEAPGVRPDLLSMDVYRRPGATGCPVIVWVHGGGWRVGDKRGNAIDTKVAWAGRLGAVLVSVNYRLATPDNDVRWPAFGRDVAAAVDRVIDDAAEFGIDPSKVVLVGHSAGAQLVSIVGTNPTLLGATGRDRTAVRCVVSLDSAAYDLTTGLADDEDGIYATAFGQDPATLADASPTLQARTQPGSMPSFLVVTRGVPRREVIARDFATAVREAGGSADVLDANPYTHEQVNTRLGVPGEQVVTPPVEAFLERCLR
ncbi:MAG: alpha/beta hydrolase [Microthrixaceae bacterium]